MENTIICLAVYRTKYDSNKGLHYMAVLVYFTEKDK